MKQANDTTPARQQDPNCMPPLKRAIPLGLQHVLAMFVGNITVPIIIAGILYSWLLPSCWSPWVYTSLPKDFSQWPRS
jgi:hypothetical protein